ncbi:hypothetical protein PENSPDRAFT_647695 [Peniophora sp. CONT]|nr:hypothetical protein PENSPDRAFT_647695 [Peniophora sp. CONT]
MEDRVRKQFFTDHPFETFRPRTLVEDERVDEDHPVQGEAWTRLRERGRNPSPEDAIQFAVTLYKHHGVSLSNAYQTAVAQFRALRAEHHLMTAYAAQEAEAQGAIFGPTPVTAGFEAENAVMAQNVEIKARADQSDIIARKRWRMVVPPGGPQGEWSRGQEYVQLWRSGVRPNYEALITPLDADPLAALEQQKAQIDRLSMQPA